MVDSTAVALFKGFCENCRVAEPLTRKNRRCRIERCELGGEPNPAASSSSFWSSASLSARTCSCNSLAPMVRSTRFRTYDRGLLAARDAWLKVMM